MVMVHPAPPPAEPRRRSLFGLRRKPAAAAAAAAGAETAQQYGGMHMGSGAFAAAGSIPQVRAPQSAPQWQQQQQQQQHYAPSQHQQQAAYRQAQQPREAPRSQSPTARRRGSLDSQPSSSTPPRSAKAASSSQPFPGDTAGLDEGECSASASYESSLGSAGQKSSSATSGEGHSRARSHFSIPDVVVTAAEEDGQTQHFEHQVPDQKRRSFVFASTSAAAQSSHDDPSAGPTSPTSPTRKRIPRPKPLIRLDSDGNGGVLQKAAPDAAASPTSPTSPTSTSSGTAKRTRKGSFPALFGRRGSDAESGGDASSNDSAFSLPASSASRDEMYRTADSVAGPSSPPGSPQRAARAPAAPMHAPLPPPAPTPRAPLTKKQVRAREKEEATLIKELEKVDRMVRAHDRKAAKEAERASKRERKRLAAAAVETPLKPSQQQESKTSKALRRMTIFSTGPKTVRRRPSSARRDGRPASGHAAAAAAEAQARQAQAPPKDSDDSTRSTAWSSREWTDVKVAMPRGQMPSLVHPSDAAAFGPAAPAPAPMVRSGSVQRARARAEAEGLSRQRNSLRRTGSQTRMSGSAGGPTKRRSFIAASTLQQRGSRAEDEMLGWEEEVEADLQRVERAHAGDETPRPKETIQRVAQQQQQPQQQRAPSPRDDGRASPSISYSRPFRASSESERDTRASDVATPTSMVSPPPAAPTTPPRVSAVQAHSARSQSSPPRPLASRAAEAGTASQPRAAAASNSSPPRPTRAPRGAGANPPGFSFPPRQAPQQRADTLPLAASAQAAARSAMQAAAAGPPQQGMTRSASDPRFL